MKYWKDIWDSPIEHNKDAAWIEDVTKDCIHVRQQSNLIVSVADIRNKLGGMSNWNAPGPDQVQIFWIKS